MRPNIRIMPERGGVVNINNVAVKSAFRQWHHYQQDYFKLARYYDGDHNIKYSAGEGAKIITNYCQYITDAISGYITGNPIVYAHADGDTAAEEVIKHHDAHNGREQDAELLTELSKFGRAYRLLYHEDDEHLTPKCTILNPLQAFVCYTGTVEPVSLFGATVSSIRDEHDVTIWFMDLYTDTEVQHWISTGDDGPWAQDPDRPPEPHRFGRVPLVEYKNNKNGIGDYEPIISLQDAYNRIMSDRQDDKDSFSNAMLAIQGQILGRSPQEIKENAEEIKSTKVLQLDEGANIQWLTKTLNEADTQVLADAINRDIHKIAMIPDMTDEAFSSNASGVAMLYKLYGTDTLASRKLTQFKKGQRYYFKCIEAALHNTGAGPYTSKMDMAGLTIAFKPKVPCDVAYEAQSIATLAATGVVSRQTLREQLSFIQDPIKEGDRVAEEEAHELEREKRAYADEFGYNNEEA